MGKPITSLSHFAAIFPVVNPLKTAQWYRQNLGFEITFEWGEPVSYVVTKREEAVSIHFVEKADDYKPSQCHNTLYIFCHDVDAVYKEVKSKGVSIITTIQTHDYGMRDFDIIDPNGYAISFGMGVH